MRVDFAGGIIELRKPTPAEVLAFEEARRALEAPGAGAIGGLDDGRETIAACVTNMSPEAAAAALRKYPGLIRHKLRAAFRTVGECGLGLEQDPAAITHEHRKVFAAQDLVGLRCFGAAVVLRPLSPERYVLMEKRAARDAVGFGIPQTELAGIGKEHMVAPAPGPEQDTLLTEHPYLALDLGELLVKLASGNENATLGKLVPSSRTLTETSSKTPASTSPHSTGSGGSESAAQQP